MTGHEILTRKFTKSISCVIQPFPCHTIYSFIMNWIYEYFVAVRKSNDVIRNIVQRRHWLIEQNWSIKIEDQMWGTKIKVMITTKGIGVQRAITEMAKLVKYISYRWLLPQMTT